MLYQLSYSPVLLHCAAPLGCAASVATSGARLLGVHRRALGLLFAVLAAGLVAIAVLAALEGGRAWVIAAAAAAVGLWMADLARRVLVPRR